MDLSQPLASVANPDPEERREPSSMHDEALFLTLSKQITADLTHSENWRADAVCEYAFVAGHGQWTDKEKQVLEDEQRPVVTFNKTLKFVKALCGIEANNRREIVYLPRDFNEPGEVSANEMLTVGSQWMAEGCQADRQQSQSFRDAVICGMGWTEGTIDTDDEPRGKYDEDRCDPLEMFWDRNSRAPNLADAKRRGRVRRMTLGEARSLLPGVTDAPGVTASDLDAIWASGYRAKADNEGSYKERREADKGSNAKEMSDYDDDTEVHVVQVQWWEYETYVRTVDLSDESGQKHVDLTAEQFEQLNEAATANGIKLPSAKLRRKVFKEALLGNRVLWSGDCKRKNGFTFNCITWEADDVAGTWFGIVRVLRDPQKWANKFFSQLMHMINSTAKGGILAEKGVFPDIRQAQKTYARQGAITEVSDGALQKGRIQPKPGAAITGGVAALLQIADAAFGDTTGVNLELMGLADREQAGVLEAQRKQAAMTILATLFDSYSGFMQDVGGMRLYFLQNYLADDRLIRVKGDDGYQVLPLIKDKVLGSYDVIVDDAPASPDTKEKTWLALQPLMPIIASSKEALAATLDYLPYVPQKLIAAFKKILMAPNEGEQQMQMLELQSQQSEIKKNEAGAQQAMANAALAMARAVSEMAKTRGAHAETMISATQAQQRALPGPAIAEDDVIMGSVNSEFRSPQQIEQPAVPMDPQPQTPMAPGGVAQPNGIVPPGGI